MTQYIPQDGIYVYFRHNAEKTVMVVMSQNEQDKTLTTKRFSENMTGFTKGKNILTDTNISDLSQLSVPTMSVQVIELMR